MHKTHWGTTLIAAAAGLALSAIPSNSAANIQQTTEEATEMYVGGGELIHGIVVLAIVMIAVTASRIIKRKT